MEGTSTSSGPFTSIKAAGDFQPGGIGFSFDETVALQGPRGLDSRDWMSGGVDGTRTRRDFSGHA